MSYEKLNGYQALAVYKSDNANIPYPEVVVSGEASATVTDKLKIETPTLKKINSRLKLKAENMGLYQRSKLIDEITN